MKVVLVFAFLLVSCASATKPASVVVSEAPVPVKVASSPDAKPASEVPANSPKEGMDGLEISCSLAKDERALTVVPKGEGCALHYRKYGKSSVIGQSYKQADFCEVLRGKIQRKLEAAGFACHSN